METSLSHTQLHVHYYTNDASPFQQALSAGIYHYFRSSSTTNSSLSSSILRFPTWVLLSFRGRKTRQRITSILSWTCEMDEAFFFLW